MDLDPGPAEANSGTRTMNIEGRIFRIGAWLTAGGSLLAGLLFGMKAGVSFLAGGALAGINLAMLRAAVNAAIFYDPKRSKRRILAGYFLRLLLIPLCLYAMIRFLFLGILAAVAGFALFNCSIFIEGILEARKDSLKRHARVERNRQFPE